MVSPRPHRAITANAIALALASLALSFSACAERPDKLPGPKTVTPKNKASKNTASKNTASKNTASKNTASKNTASKTNKTIALRGQVVWLAEALREQHGINTVAEAKERVLALKTSGGHLYPIVEDVRGRAFRRDRRLREMQVELLVRQAPNSPVIQIIGVRHLKADGKYDVDYWCDICSIAMYELKPCDCCQAPIRLRERKRKEANRNPTR